MKSSLSKVSSLIEALYFSFPNFINGWDLISSSLMRFEGFGVRIFKIRSLHSEEIFVSSDGGNSTLH